MLSRVATSSSHTPLICAALTRRAFSAKVEYDLAVIGAGPGGYVAAIKAAQLGLKVGRELLLFQVLGDRVQEPWGLRVQTTSSFLLL